MPELATPGRNSAAHDVNSSGVIVGDAEPAGIERPYPVWWDSDGALHDLPGDYPGRAYDVNASGVVVGLSDADGLSPLRWASPTTPATRLTPLPGGENYAAAFAVNDSGTAVGFLTGDRRHLPRRAVERERRRREARRPGRPPDLPRRRHQRRRHHAFGGVTCLDTLGGTHGVAMDINDNGTIVGRTHSPTTSSTRRSGTTPASRKSCVGLQVAFDPEADACTAWKAWSSHWRK